LPRYPTILSHAQIKALLKNNPYQEDGNAAEESMNGSGNIYDLYHFLEQSGSHYVSLLVQAVPDVSAASAAASQSIADSPCQPTPSDSPPKTVFFYKTWLSDTKDQEDAVIAADEE
jgi:hypothetical protein